MIGNLWGGDEKDGERLPAFLFYRGAECSICCILGPNLLPAYLKDSANIKKEIIAIKTIIANTHQ